MLLNVIKLNKSLSIYQKNIGNYMSNLLEKLNIPVGSWLDTVMATFRSAKQPSAAAAAVSPTKLKSNLKLLSIWTNKIKS